MRSSVDLPQPEGPRMVMKSLSATLSETGSSARVGSRRARAGNVRLTSSMRSLLTRRLHGNSERLAALNRKSETNPIRPMTMMPKMICPVLSSAWLSTIMWPMPEDEPISSATMT